MTLRPDFNKLSPDLTRKEFLELFYLMVMVLILKKLIKLSGQN